VFPNTHTEVHPSPEPSTSLLEPPNIPKTTTKTPPQNNARASTSTSILPELHNLESSSNTDIIDFELEQPCGTKRSLPESFYTQSAPSSPINLAQEINEMLTSLNWETSQIKQLKKKE
jgi:hypothetical protein